jgi:hypothetical protein
LCKQFALPLADAAFVLPVQCVQVLDKDTIYLFSIILHIGKHGGQYSSHRKKQVTLLFKFIDPESMKKHADVIAILRQPLKSIDLDETWIVCDGLFRDGLRRPLMMVRNL